MDATDDALAAVEARREEYLEDLFALLREPGVSATGDGIESCVATLSELLAGYGFDVDVVETPGAPLVCAEAGPADPDAPTVLCYGHYDVQPPGDESLWTTPPFEPTVRDGAVYARGSGDNKGQLLAHAFAADALRAARGDLPVRLKLLVEGEEESGSHGLRWFVGREPAPERLACDLVYVADGPMHRSRRPTLVYGNRGVLGVELSLRTADRDLHSGNFGGPVPNAANELVAVLASTYDGDRVTVPGFYDDVATTGAARELAASVPFDPEELRADVGVDRLSVPPERYQERVSLEPTLTVNGVHAGYGGDGTKTIVPCEATAKLDLRLVPDQDPDAVFERLAAHVREVNPDVAVEKLVSFPPLSTPVDVPAAGDVRAALSAVWEAEPVELPMLGGSMPAAYLREAVDAPVLLVPYANPDQANHAPDEHLDLDCFENGVKTSAAVFERLGRDEQRAADAS